MSRGIEHLNDDCLYLILQQQSNLALTCRRFWHLWEQISRSQAMRILGDPRLLAQFKDDCSDLLHLDSWTVAAYLAKFDFWFFESQHVVGLQDCDISDAMSSSNRTDLAQGIWRRVHGMPWGVSLNVSNVLWLHLRYQTKLAPGRYKVCINLRVSDLANLRPIKFAVVRSPHVTQLGSPFPTGQVERVGGEGTGFDYNSRELFTSVLQVDGEPTGTWPYATFEIEETGPFTNRDILFNYLYFERVSDDYEPSDLWVLQNTNFWPTPEWVEIFDRHRQRKFAQKGRE